MLPQRLAVWYCHGPEGKRGHYGGPSDPVQQGEGGPGTTLSRVLNLYPQSRPLELSSII